MARNTSTQTPIRILQMDCPTEEALPRQNPASSVHGVFAVADTVKDSRQALAELHALGNRLRLLRAPTAPTA